MHMNRTAAASNGKTRNVIISGTNFWNPGDDFVRDGVVRLVEALFEGDGINLLFYNFNEDFLPSSKFRGISNMLGADDLRQVRDYVDAVVIAGLSAGREIKDLYRWVIDNGLTDRVFMIGAGYENSYVDEHIRQEPEATLFKQARVITGRTQKRPEFIDAHQLPYHHINCPAILSVETTKTIPAGKKIEKIGFSIQLPHEIGIANHSVKGSMYQLAVEILQSLCQRYDVRIVAHHKSEYFHFLKHLVHSRIPIYFSSFYQDLYELYRQFDLVISTRLHACLYANGHGLPAIIVNDTDRHTHCADGFSHSIWVNRMDRFEHVFAEMSHWDLQQVARDAATFKEHLLQHYLEVLAPCIKGNVAAAGQVDTKRNATKELSHSSSRKPSGPSGATQTLQPIQDSATSLSGRLHALVASDMTSKRRVLNLLERLTKDHWLERNIAVYREIIEHQRSCFDSASFLNWYADHFKPTYYLEVGVRRGRSMVQVMCQSPDTRVYGFDMWLPDYGSILEHKISSHNPGPAFVIRELRNLGVEQIPALIKGDSHVTLEQFWQDSTNPGQFDLITVDGDHSYGGAKQDLDICFEHLADSGVLLFDDINHPAHPDLAGLWNEIITDHPDYLFISDDFGMGTGVAFKPPLDRLAKIFGL